jgi:ABC-type nitrate/sulfonate/bicarbonate transport system substrate-binding protein
MALITAAVSAVAVLAACGSSGGSDSKTSSSEPEETVTFGTGTITLNLAIPLTAMGLGAFAKAHLNVKFADAPSAATLLATGDADMIFDQAANVPLLNSEGQHTKAIAAVTEDTRAGLVASKSVTSIAQLQAMGTNCTLASLGRGILFAYQNYWVSKYHLKCKISTLSDYTLVPAGIVSGRFTAASELASNVSSLTKTGALRWLINPLAPNYVSSGYGLGYNYVNNAVVAEDSYISQNKETITRFFTVLKQTEAKMQTMSATQIAQAIHDSGVSYYSSQSVAAIAQQLTADGSAASIFVLNSMHLAPITASAWASTMRSLPAEGVAVNPTDPRWNFANGVDNSFAQAVFGS